MKKISILLIFIIIMISGFSGCTKGFSFQVAGVENNTNHKMSASYFKSSGTKEKELTVDDGETLEITVDIETKSGSIDVCIFNEDKENIYEGEDIETSSFKVELTDPGKYTIQVKTAKHTGSYSFKW